MGTGTVLSFPPQYSYSLEQYLAHSSYSFNIVRKKKKMTVIIVLSISDLNPDTSLLKFVYLDKSNTTLKMVSNSYRNVFFRERFLKAYLQSNG